MSSDRKRLNSCLGSNQLLVSAIDNELSGVDNISAWNDICWILANKDLFCSLYDELQERFKNTCSDGFESLPKYFKGREFTGDLWLSKVVKGNKPVDKEKETLMSKQMLEDNVLMTCVTDYMMVNFHDKSLFRLGPGPECTSFPTDDFRYLNEIISNKKMESITSHNLVLRV